MKIYRKIKQNFRKGKKFFQKNKKLILIVFVMFLTIGLYNLNSMISKNQVDFASCQKLLDLIGQAESRGNYNAYFSNAANNKIPFSDMTISEVLSWQDEFVKKGSPSSAVGKYQILNTTLRSLIKKHNIDINEKFSPKNQDTMALYLLQKRGVGEYINNRISKVDFAKNLSQEWASLPVTKGSNPEKSFYDGDGLNGSLVDSGSLLDAISEIKPTENSNKNH